MNKKFTKIGFIGAGKMAQAIIKGIIKSNFYSVDNIFASEPNEDLAKKVEKDFGIKVFQSNKDLVKNVDIVFFAVKPFVAKEVISDIKFEINKEQLFVSILAGISTDFIQKELGQDVSVVRVMPNTPALVNEGMSALCKGRYATSSQLDFVENIFECLGKVIQIEESQIDIITAISGSSPAFYYYFIDAIAKSAREMGFDYDIALMAAAQSALGSAKMILETGVSPSVLIDNVTTKGGTTEVGMNILSSAGVEKIVDRAVKGTAEKAAMLGK